MKKEFLFCGESVIIERKNGIVFSKGEEWNR